MSASARLQARSVESADPILFSAAVEACPESMAIVESGRFLFANRALAQMFGHRHGSEIWGRPVSAFVPAFAPGLDPALSPVRSAKDRRWSRPSAAHASQSHTIGSGHFLFELSGERGKGVRAQMEVSYAGFRVRDRNLLVLSARDVSQGKRIERQLHASERMEAMGRLVGGVAHDFNNLLTGIMLYCDLLIAGLNGNTRLRGHAEEIRRAGENSTALIRQLLTVARRQAVAPRPLVWKQVVSGIRDLLARLIGEDIELVSRLAPDLGCILMDPAQAQQIILNLVLNARDAMPSGGRVTLQTRNSNASLTSLGRHRPKETACVELSVTDSGCGMDAETRSRLFEPFFTSKQPGHGTGLGLTTVHNIARQAGGIIEVQSEPGKGARVSVCLPRIDAPTDISTRKRKR
jgi:signal transduction histidine kinase